MTATWKVTFLGPWCVRIQHVLAIIDRWNAANFSTTRFVCSANGFATRSVRQSHLTRFSHVVIMACTMKDEQCVKHMSTTWIVSQTMHKRCTNISKMFPRLMIDNIKNFSSNISRWNVLYRRDLSAIDLSYQNFTHVECHIWQRHCWLIHYSLTPCDWQFRFCVSSVSLIL
jgi:hypothetical protein